MQHNLNRLLFNDKKKFENYLINDFKVYFIRIHDVLKLYSR